MLPAASARPRSLLIDTNLLLVLIVGSHDRNQVERFKRTRAYTADDYDLLTRFVAGFGELAVTPNVLTEVSNLVGQLSEPLRGRVLASLAMLAIQVPERYFPSSDMVREPDFLRFGLTDVSVLLTARGQVAVLTDDLPLYLKLSALDLYVVNFNHLRTGASDV
jgi:hypothetical protein